MCYRMWFGCKPYLTANLAISLPQYRMLIWRGLWWSCRSLYRCQLTQAFKTFVLTGAGGMVWLLWPCDTLETGISVLTLLVSALLRRLGSHPEIGWLICILGFVMIYKHPPTVSGFIFVLAFSAPVQCSTSGLMSPATFFYSANDSDAKNCLSTGHLRYWFLITDFIVFVNRSVYLNNVLLVDFSCCYGMQPRPATLRMEQGWPFTAIQPSPSQVSWSSCYFACISELKVTGLKLWFMVDADRRSYAGFLISFVEVFSVENPHGASSLPSGLISKFLVKLLFNGTWVLLQMFIIFIVIQYCFKAHPIWVDTTVLRFWLRIWPQRSDPATVLLRLVFKQCV